MEEGRGHVVTVDDFNKYFTEKGADRPCPDCGVTDWKLPSNSNDYSSPSLEVDLLNSQFDNVNASAFTAFCGNCGHMKFYAAPLVKAWRLKRG